MTATESSNTTTVILGTGIIGLFTAYYLSESGNTDAKSIHLVESSPALFHSASGLAGGFLAQEWFAPPVASLGALSYKLHAQLAESHDGRTQWGYAHSTGISLSQDSEEAVGGSGEDWLESGTSRAQLANQNQPCKERTGPQWLRCTKEGTMEIISRGGTTAQIDPLRLCRWLLSQCQGRGVTLHMPAKALSLTQDAHGILNGIRISQNGEKTYQLPCTRLVITSGAWSPRVFSTLFPRATTRIPISALGGHSLLVRNPHFKPDEAEKELCHAVFATDTLGFSPEWFARTGGELYLTGLTSTMIPLPDIATEVRASEDSFEKLKACAKVMMVGVPGKELEVLREGLCFRPVTPSGRPIVTRIPDEKLGGIKTPSGAQGGVYIAAGHGAWGISHAPGTGLVLSELIEGRPPSAKIEALQLPS